MVGFRRAYKRAAASLFAGLLGAIFHSGAVAQEYPTRPIRIIMGFGAGGLADIAARVMGEKLSQSIGQPVIIENMPGPGGIAAAAKVARAEPDGHSILWVSGQNAISASWFKSLAYDPVADFVPISQTTTFDYIILAKKDGPIKTVADLIAAAKANPKGFNIGTISAGSAQHLTALLFVSMADLSVPTVPFRTTGDTITALMAGELQAVFETVPGAMSHVRAGSIHPVALAGEKPRDVMPGVPIVSESGLPGYNLVSWNGLMVPAKTPKPIVEKLNQEVTKALQNADVTKRFREVGLEPTPSTPAQLQAIYEADIARWKKIIQDNKLGQ